MYSVSEASTWCTVRYYHLEGLHSYYGPFILFCMGEKAGCPKISGSLCYLWRGGRWTRGGFAHFKGCRWEAVAGGHSHLLSGSDLRRDHHSLKRRPHTAPDRLLMNSLQESSSGADAGQMAPGQEETPQIYILSNERRHPVRCGWNVPRK